jgi:hypothetical protein
MNETAMPSPDDKELRDLRARAYGLDPDIQDDPVALARLVELEAAHLGGEKSPEPAETAAEAVLVVAAPTRSAETTEEVRPRSFWQAVKSTSNGRRWLLGGSVVLVVAILYAVSWFAPQRPETTLQPTALKADDATLRALSFAPLAEVDTETLRGYEPYRGVRPWIAENAQGSRCLMAISGNILWGIRCTPGEAELMLDLNVSPLDPAPYSEGLADGTVIRFRVNGDSVEAYVYPPPTAQGQRGGSVPV